MTFANPAWLGALFLLLPLIGLRVLSQARSRRSLEGLVAARLYPSLVRGSSQLRHWLSFSFLLAGLAGVVVAMARPQWGYEEVESYSEGRSLILAIDTSRSMLATDLVPNRLERAKLAARDIVDSLPQDRIGLIAFAGRAFLQAPLTTDHLAVIESIDQIDTEIIPRGGTNLTAAVQLALKTFGESSSDQNALILFSDGEALEGQGAVQSIKELADRESMIVITIGVGTEQGSIIPEPGPDGRPQEGVFIRDADGQVVRSRLDPVALRRLATGGGMYIQLGDRASLTRVVRVITENLTKSREADEAKKRPIERFMWPLGIGVFLLILAHLVPLLFFGRRPTPRLAKAPSPGAKSLSVALVVLFAGLSLPLASRDSRDAWSDLVEEDFEAALEKFESSLKNERLSGRERTAIHLGIGSSAYRLGDYERAAKAYGEALIRPDRRTREQAHYNLGNTLFRRGEMTLTPPPGDPEAPAAVEVDEKTREAALRQWRGALEHYEAALALNRENADAEHNIEVVRERIRQLEEEMQQQEQQQEQQQQDQQDQQQQDQQQQDEQQQNQQQQDNQQQQQQEDQPRDEEEGDDGEDRADQESEGGDGERGEPREEEPENNGGSDSSEEGKNEGEPESPQESGEGESSEPPPGGNEPVEQPPDPGDGELSAAPGGEQPPPDRRESPGEQVNSETGYSPSEARQLIEALADEDGELRPVYPRPFQAEKFKNW